ncbi:zeta toxin family protein [Micromonospora olivasterospora]|uniref:UDP-N-acetylglucosamine kinase n=1 Tax=Micromonospora olivasterospora TaxID=1880 RepID=A0A562IJ96_MICOL|nr:zeta toxin family protein [Micromonospora olivasterospora]TWH71010.1 zeta toxin [Micromonospora olivasterospora]
MFRAAGYRVEAAIMAVPEPLSRLGIIHRYHDQVQKLGYGRLTARDNHDASYQGVRRAAETIDRDRIVDVATVYRRGNQQLHTNHLDGASAWRWPAGTAAAIDAERQRPWTPEETKAFAATVKQLFDEMGPEWHEELRDIVRLAAPLADRQTPLPEIAEISPAITAAAKAFPTSTRQSLPRQPAERDAVPPPPRASRETSRGEEPTR